MKAYLVGYNITACVGWAYVLLLTLRGLGAGKTSLAIWNQVGLPLMVVQSSAALEILHSLLGLVRSPLSSTFIQVMSRLLIMWVYTWWSPECHQHWSLVLMVLAWCFVEVPRYLFYTLNLFPQFEGKNMPYVLFALRYSLFMVLYPAGITGEILQIVQALPFLHSVNPVFARLAHIHLATYVPFGPYMIFNMWYMRKRAFKKRAEESMPPKPLEGLIWPVTNEKTGERSTTVTNKVIWEQSVAAVDEDAANAVRKVRNWRFGYVKQVENNLRVCMKSKVKALQVAEAGLKAAKESFEFVRDGKTVLLKDMMKVSDKSFETGFIKGEGKKSQKDMKLVVPYKGKNLEGLEILAQLDKWVENGTIEPSASEAIALCVKNKDWMDLSDKYFVLLGATSAMGPLNALLELGANIIAIDIDREHVWKRLIEQARKSCGTLTFPLKKTQSSLKDDAELFKNAGANLLTMTPEIANWIATVHPGKSLTIGNYTYLDGALHVQLSLACDCIMEEVCKLRKDTSIAFLCTPTDCHVIPKEAHDAAQKNYKNAPAWQKALEALDGKSNLVRNALPPVKESNLYLVDGIVCDQGPNYALAKRLQHWRAVIAYSKGHVVSSNIAPSTATQSVVSNAQFAAAYGGFHLFKAMEVMYQDTSSAVMLALLVHDLRNPKSVANPAANDLTNPFELFSSGSFHGGVWRCGYKIGSIGVTSAVYWYLTTYKTVVIGALAAVYSTFQYVRKGSPI